MKPKAQVSGPPELPASENLVFVLMVGLALSKMNLLKTTGYSKVFQVSSNPMLHRPLKSVSYTAFNPAFRDKDNGLAK